MKAHDDLTFNEIGTTMAYYDLTFNMIGATMAYYDLTFNVIGTTMAQDDLTFNVIGATMERQTPLLAYINQEFVAIKRNCSDGTLVATDCLSIAQGLRWQTAASPLLGFAEGSSTAFLFLWSARRS